MLLWATFDQNSVIVRLKLLDSTVSTGAGKTGLSSASSGLIISTIADSEATPTVYTQAGSTIETITTLATYAAPTATKCRFKEVDATNHKGIYELQFADARFSIAAAKSLLISISGVTGVAECDAVIPLPVIDLFAASVPATVAGAVGSVTGLTASDVGAIKTKTDSLTFTGAGKVDASLRDWLGSAPNALQSGRVDSYVGAILNGVIAAASFASGALDAVWSTAARTLTAFGFTVPATVAGSVGSVTGNVGGNVVGSVASVTADVGITQAGADKAWSTTTRALTDKVGFALSPAGVQAIWDALTSALTTVGSIGKLLVDNINATISSRSTYAGADTAGTTTLLSRLASALTITGGKVDVNDKTGFELVAAYDPAKTAAQAGDAMALTSGERTSVGTAVWATTTRTLSSFGTLVADVATAVWGAATRTLTAFSFSVTVGTNSDKTGYALTSGEEDAIADKVWDEAIAGHLGAGSTGAGLNAAGSAGDPWTTALPGAYGAGTAGKIVGDRLDVAVGTRLATAGYTAPDNAGIATGEASAAAAAISAASADTKATAIKTKTDQLAFTVANQVDANALTGGGTGLTAQETRDAMKLAPTAGAPDAGSIDEELDTLDAKLGPITGADDNNVLGILRAVMRLDVPAPTDVGGTYNPGTAALEQLSAAIDDIPSSVPTPLTAQQTRDAMELVSTAAADGIDSQLLLIGANIDAFKTRELPMSRGLPFAAFEFVMYDATDHISPLPGLTVTAERSLDGAAFEPCDNAAAEVSNGVYEIDLTGADNNAKVFTLRFTAPGADDTLVTILTTPVLV